MVKALWLPLIVVQLNLVPWLYTALYTSTGHLLLKDSTAV